MNDSNLKALVIGGFALMFVLAIAAKKCELDRNREPSPHYSYEPVRMPAFELGPRHYGLQYCIEEAKQTPTNDNILMRYFLEPSCEGSFDRAAADPAFSAGAREAFTRLGGRQRTLRLQLAEIDRDAPIEEVTLLAKPRLRAAYQLDPFMREIQRIAPSNSFPEAAPTGPVKPIR